MSVIVFAEQRAGSLRQVAFETVTAGRQVADALGVELTSLALGPPSLDPGELAAYGADQIVIGRADTFQEYVPTAYTAALAKLARERGAKVVLLPASAQGKDLAPRVAAHLRAGLASDVTQVAVEDGRLTVVRPIYAGKVLMKLAFKAEPAVLSLRPRAYMATQKPREPTVEELSLDGDQLAAHEEVRTLAGEKKERPDVAEAEIIVAGGRGMQGPENWKLLETLADALGSGTALGASRAVVDAGWRPHGEQVGQTGKVVAPPLYFAIGISGAIQHQAGMRTANCIVAINKDAEAPIFKIADYGIVGDLFQVVPRLTEEIRNLRSED